MRVPSGARRRFLPGVVLVLTCLAPAGCTLRLGGPAPRPFSVAALLVAGDEDQELVAERLARLEADLSVVLAPHPADWFHSVVGPGGIIPEGDGSFGVGVTAPGVGEPSAPALPPLRSPGPVVPPILVEGRFTVGRRPLHLLAARVEDEEGGVEATATAVLQRLGDEAPPDAVVLVVVVLVDPSDGPLLDRLVGEYLLGPESCGVPTMPPSTLRLYRAPVALVDCLRATTGEGESVRLELITTG